jgi:signal transduction histidine kinase/ligand-binding sensor domain-containing protein/DNA-binding response OmpR family regulator
MISWNLSTRLYLIFAITLFASSASAQLKCNLKHYSTEDGLSHDRVLCMTKDSEGFMWFGTWDGINRFDGHNFIAYKARPGDSSNLKNNKIRNIVEDKLGYLWVKTYDNEVYRFDKRTEKFLAVPETGTSNQFKNILIDKIIPVSNGDTWLSTNKQGLLCSIGDRSLAAPHIEQYAKSVTGENKICGNKINFLFEDSEKRIWIGTSTGLCCLVKDGAKYKKLYFANKQPFFGTDLNFTCFTEHNGIIYFGTDKGKLITYNIRSGGFITREINKGVAINSLCFSKSNVLYASTSGKGLAIIDPVSFNVTYAGMSGKDTFYSLFEDRSGLLWIEPGAIGVIKYNPDTKSFKLFTQKVDANISGPHTNYSVFNDANGIVWVSMRGGGFGYYNAANDDMAYFYDEPGSANQQFSNIITALYVDATGILWLSAYEGGIYRAIFQPDNFDHQLLVKTPKNKTENEVRAIYEDRSGKLWIGTKAGRLYCFKNGKSINNVFINMPAGGIGTVYTITQGKNGTLWFGTKGSGLFKAEPLANDDQKYNLTHYDSDPHNVNSLSNRKIYSVLEDSRGRVWVGTFGGGINLMVKDGDKTIFKNSNNSFKNYPIAACNVVRHLQEDAKGNIWVATNNGLVIFNPNENTPDTYKFYRYYKIPGDPTSLGNNDVQFIYKDKTGGMWLGTFGGGLHKLVSAPDLHQKLKFKFFTTADGLPNDIILSIVGDNSGNLWLTTENGLSKYDPKAGVFQNYDYYDGLPNTKFSEAACSKSISGKILLGCLTGYISFDPDKVYETKFNANIAFTNIQLYNQTVIPGADGSVLKYPIDQTDHITLNYDQNLISIDYTVLDYRDIHKISYAYKLDGVDKDWNYVKTQRQATYTNLSPGKYVFKVKSVSNELFKNTPEKSVAITILPPPWLTIWAYIIYFILAVIAFEITRRIIVTMIRLRNRVVVEQKLTELKLQFFTNISHELKTPLTLIVSPLQEITKIENLSPKGREYINVVNKNANRMIRFINQLLDFRKAQSGKMRLKVSEVDVVALVRQISQYFTELAHEKNIDLVVRANVDELYVWIDEEKLDIVIYNLLSNAFKFTPAYKKIVLEIVFNNGDECFYINVIDQGVGVPKDKLLEIFELYYEGDKSNGNNLKGTGIGLALSRELVLNHHGKITAKNNEDSGMTFSLELKTGKDHFDDKEVDFVSMAQVPEFIQSLYVDGPDTEVDVLKQTNTHAPLVLIVEDNTDLRRFLCNQLSVSYKVIEAADGAEGLKAAMDSLPDLIISDVMMPNMDGIEMLDQLKNNIVTSHIPVILLTAKSSIDNQIEGLKYGADFYITKPFHTDFILACVESLIKKRKQLFEQLLGNKSLVQLSPGEIFITSKDEQLLKETIRIVEEGMVDPDFNIDSVAVSVGLGRTTFYKKLKSLTGLAPVEFVRDIRLQRGQQLLCSGEYNISEIAYKIGFSSSGYFSTCFKEKYNLTPSQYLKKEKDIIIP